MWSLSQLLPIHTVSLDSGFSHTTRYKCCRYRYCRCRSCCQYIQSLCIVVLSSITRYDMLSLSLLVPIYSLSWQWPFLVLFCIYIYIGYTVTHTNIYTDTHSNSTIYTMTTFVPCRMKKINNQCDHRQCCKLEHKM